MDCPDVRIRKAWNVWPVWADDGERVAKEETGDADDKAVILVLARIIASLVPWFSAGMAHTPNK